MTTTLPTQPPEAIRTPSDEMPDPDNLRVDRFSLPTAPTRLNPAPAIGEHLAPARHRAEFSRTA